jgi:hypothetical protein
MSSTEDRLRDAEGTAGAGSVDMKVEVVVIPVSDVDRGTCMAGKTDGGALMASLSG